MALNVTAFLQNKERTASPAMAAKWSELEQLHSKRLWHQLTVQLLELAKEPDLLKGKALVEMYDNFLREVELRINKLSYMELCTLIVTQYDTPQEAEGFLDHCENLVKSDLVALALCKVTRGQIKLEQQQDLPSVKELLEEVEDIFRQIDGISSVHGRFYRLQSKFYLGQGLLTEYYQSAIKFLGCTPLNTLPLAEQREHAKNLAISSLVADGMYNFGELLAHPILDSLRRTQEEWLLYLLKAFNAGDVTEFENLKRRWSTNKLLAENEKRLRNKVILLAIMETTFQRSATERQLTFEDITHVTKLPLDQVELYVMKAMAQGLVEGKIDNVGQKVYMTWVQPRVLGTDQIKNMISRLGDWQSMIVQAEDMMNRSDSESGGYEHLGSLKYLNI